MAGKKRILIIDDEEDFAQMVKLILEGAGDYEVAMETRGSQGLQAAQDFKPDLILLDIIIPDMEGSEVARRIKDNKELKDIPIVFITAALTKDEARSKDGLIGGRPFIAKPVTIKELIDCIENNITKK